MSTQTADAIIIGGGVIGLSIAYYLAQRQFGRIVALEREVIGSGSSGRSVASIDLFSALPAAIELQAYAYDIFANFEERLGQECGLVTTGSTVLVGPEQAAALQTAAEITRATGVEVQLLDPPTLAKLEPAIDTKGLAAACYMPAGGYADPMLTANAFASAARRAGVTIRPGQPVTGLSYSGGRVIGVKIAAEAIAAPVVVCAAGPWSGRLLRTFGLADLGLYAVRHAVIVMQRPETFGRPHLSILDLTTKLYARPEAGNLTLAGSIDPAIGYDPVEPDDNFPTVTSEYTFWAAERLAQRYPALENGRLRQGWSGLMSISPDWQPLLGAFPDVSGLYIAAGFSGQGIKISPAVGDLMAGLMAGESQAAQLLAPFRPTRFAEDQPFMTNGFVAIG